MIRVSPLGIMIFKTVFLDHLCAFLNYPTPSMRQGRPRGNLRLLRLIPPAWGLWRKRERGFPLVALGAPDHTLKLTLGIIIISGNIIVAVRVLRSYEMMVSRVCGGVGGDADSDLSGKRGNFERKSKSLGILSLFYLPLNFCEEERARLELLSTADSLKTGWGRLTLTTGSNQPKSAEKRKSFKDDL